MIEIRWVDDGSGNWQLQQRIRQPVADASGALCGLGDWSEWSAVPVVHGPQASGVDVFTTKR